MLKHIFRAQGWEWLIELSERISLGPRPTLSSGDLLLKLISVAAQIYEPLLQLVSSRVPDSVLESALYRHPHTGHAADRLMRTGQFSHCEDCTSTSCPVNVMYCQLFSCVYFFVTNYKGLTEKKFGVGSVSS